MNICVDFDGTCVTHDYPEIGKDIGAVPVLKKLVDEGNQLILFTMRSDKFGDHLTQAVDWFKENDISLWGIQTNPEQHTWTDSPKAYGNIFIDDAALGAPLKLDLNVSPHPFIDWTKVEEILHLIGAINNK